MLHFLHRLVAGRHARAAALHASVADISPAYACPVEIVQGDGTLERVGH